MLNRFKIAADSFARWRLSLAAQLRRKPRSSTSSQPPRTWRRWCRRSGATRLRSNPLPRATRTPTSGGQAQLSPQAPAGGSADRRRPAARDRLVAAADHQSRNAKIQAGAAGYLDASRSPRSRYSGWPGDPRHGRRASPRQPALLDRPRKWPRDRQASRGTRSSSIPPMPRTPQEPFQRLRPEAHRDGAGVGLQMAAYAGTR